MAQELRWRAPEYDYKEKNISWYWLSIIGAVLILGFAVWQRNFLFGLFIIVAEILVLVWAGRRPNEVEFRAYEEGFEIVGQKSIPWSDVQNFTILKSGAQNLAEVSFQFKKKLRVPLVVKVPKDKEEAAKEFLKTFIEEREAERSLSRDLENLLRF